MNKDKLRAIKHIKAICNNKENKRIGLHLADTEVAGWKQEDKELMTPFNWKCIGYIGAMSSDFDITPEDLTKRGAKHNASKKHIKKGN